MEGQQNWVFCRVMDEPDAAGRVKIWAEDGTCQELGLTIEKRDTVPGQFTSVFASKDSITVNDREEERLYWQKQVDRGFKPVLPMVTIESSSLCNLRCQYCVVSTSYDRIWRGAISDEVLDAVLASLQQMPEVKYVSVNALGEPLTNPRFCEMLWRIYRETSIRTVYFFTNGMLLTRELSEKLAQLPLQLKIRFSIDGQTPEENGIQRRGSVYDIVRDNLLYFLQQIAGKPNFSISINNLILAPEDRQIYTPEFLLNDFGFISIDSHRAFYFPELSTEELNRQNIEIHKQANKKICRRVFGETTVRANGDVILCCWDSTCTVVVGNILKKPLKEIWHSEEYIRLRKNMAPDVPLSELPEACQKCHAMNDGYLYRQDV